MCPRTQWPPVCREPSRQSRDVENKSIRCRVPIGRERIPGPTEKQKVIMVQPSAEETKFGEDFVCFCIVCRLNVSTIRKLLQQAP